MRVAHLPVRRSLGPVLLATLLTGLLVSEPADARRFGGGRSSGMTRSISLDETPSRPVTVRSTAIHGNNNYVAPAAPSHAVADIGRESAFLLRRVQLESQLEARHQRMMAAKLRGSEEATAAATAAAAAATPTAPAALQVPAAALPTVRTVRHADPEFNRFTALPVVASACEIKPVMRDDDYIACGATPPESPMGNRR